MSIIWGDVASFNHEANGMTMGDITASMNVATKLDEVIIFRSSGPWCKRWIDWGHPTKNFHVKGKSSDWGPHAGLVPLDGVYSKVGADAGKAAKGTAANLEGEHSGFASRTQLIMSREQIDWQRGRPEGGKNAILEVVAYPSPSRDLLLVCARSGAGATRIFFRAVYNSATNKYAIKVWPVGRPQQNRFLVFDAPATRFEDFMVMTSAEVGANNMPLTGDYDLMAVCPTWAQYGSKTATSISKPGIQLPGGLNKGLSFAAGVGMDNVMDTRFHTMGRGQADAALPLAPRGQGVSYNKKGEAINRLPNMSDFHDRQRYYQQGSGFSSASLNLIFDQSQDREHQDMGNLTPRILRCINELNLAMGATGNKSAMRRVHHNAESHRNRRWGGITEKDMNTKKDGDKFGDGFPLTAFHPARLGGYFEHAVCTIESLAEFKMYAAKLKEAGFYVPRNWIWNM